MGSVLEAEGPNMAGGLGSREREAIFKELGCKVISCPGLEIISYYLWHYFEKIFHVQQSCIPGKLEAHNVCSGGEMLERDL